MILLATARRDLQDIHSHDPTARRALADEIRDACINVGFFYGETCRTMICTPALRHHPVKNHGVPEHIVSAALDAGKRFFALPQPTKDAIDIHKSSNFKGYTALLGENTDPENRGDLHEGFDIGWEDFVGTSREDDGAMTGGNVWPEGLPGFREAVLEY